MNATATKLVIKIIQTLYPSVHDGKDRSLWRIHSSFELMKKTLLRLEDKEIIKLYDKVVHNYTEPE